MTKVLFSLSLLLISCFNTSIFGMKCNKTIIHSMITLKNILDLNDIKPLIITLLFKQNLAAMRLVCKEWTSKDQEWNNIPNWIFMPDDIEKEHDKVIKQKRRLDPHDKNMILFTLISKNSSDAVQWIMKKKINQTIKFSGRNPIYATSYQFTISALMFAKQNKNQNIAEQLLASHNNWLNEYKKITAPEGLQKCLYSYNHHNKLDFSFLSYILAAWSDDVNTFTRLYSSKQPTNIGNKFLIDLTLRNNALNCFNVILKNNTKMIADLCTKNFSC